jgi:hypothetical protein
MPLRVRRIEAFMPLFQAPWQGDGGSMTGEVKTAQRRITVVVSPHQEHLLCLKGTNVESVLIEPP